MPVSIKARYGPAINTDEERLKRFLAEHRKYQRETAKQDGTLKQTDHRTQHLGIQLTAFQHDRRVGAAILRIWL